MAALNGGLGGAALTNGTAGTMDALTQAYSGIQQYAAAALPTLYSQSLLQQQGAAGSQKEGERHCSDTGVWSEDKTETGGVLYFKDDTGHLELLLLVPGNTIYHCMNVY